MQRNGKKEADWYPILRFSIGYLDKALFEGFGFGLMSPDINQLLYKDKTANINK